jgi:hypothetical protein
MKRYYLSEAINEGHRPPENVLKGLRECLKNTNPFDEFTITRGICASGNDAIKGPVLDAEAL